MAYKVLEKIESRGFSRAELVKLRENAALLAAKGNEDAGRVLAAIDETGVRSEDSKFIFMGFCPGGDIANRLDGRWLAEGICSFDYPESAQQLARFEGIMAGDLVIQKKREEFGVSMRLYAHGRVTEVVDDGRLLRMDWKVPGTSLEVPLMGCNSTVDIRDIETVDEEMPAAFWEWLGFDRVGGTDQAGLTLMG